MQSNLDLQKKDDTVTTGTLQCRGDWTEANAKSLQAQLSRFQPSPQQPIIIDGHSIELFDSAGALLLTHLAKRWQQAGYSVQWQRFSAQHQAIFSLLEEYVAEPIKPSPVVAFAWVQRLGEKATLLWLQILAYLSFVGHIFSEYLRWCRDPLRIRFKSICNNVHATGTNAIFIVALLSFLIGIVLAYQIGVQLRDYGANIFVVDFLGLAILREFGPMITAIIIAGRTGSSYAAQIGTMKLTEEVAALQTMGLSPIEVLVLPRVSALLIALPLLVIISEVLGLMGGMIMANIMLSLSIPDFIDRFSTVIYLPTFLIGLVKVPVFALLISSIGTFQGFQVKDSAASVGEHTTISVVQGIFMIIVADAAFSILFSQLGL